ncbi:c-type cytochrome [Salinimicrobium oceani]|uniref:Cytochrome c n=1 Tax=Salinimicrobium oceani TaxID=2722702 RepID=A0ABX1CVR9_9FLAO|nr:cytochrome c [Salinimicrobium oceani]NJW52390.1 cytochrome c [Salinimicrobium oceani]
MKSLFRTSIFFILALSFVSCVDNSKPNYQYMPNMYETVSYEPYGAYDVFVDEQEAKLPVEGTVSRGWRPYEYENSPEGFAAAKAENTNPLPYTESNLAKGKALYTIYCAVCHGDKGDGKGILVQREKILGIPSYDDAGRAITEGGVYHVQYYGLNAMGSYASQTTIEERWLITHYVMSLKNELLGSPSREFTEENTGAEGQHVDGENLIPAVNAESEIDEGEATTGEGNSNNQQENQN